MHRLPSLPLILLAVCLVAGTAGATTIDTPVLVNAVDSYDGALTLETETRTVDVNEPFSLAGTITLVSTGLPYQGLLNLQEQRGLSMLIITHDIAVARKVSDRIAVMSAGRIVEAGLTRDILTAPRNEYTHLLIHAASALHSDESHDHDAISRTRAPLHPGINETPRKGDIA